MRRLLFAALATAASCTPFFDTSLTQYIVDPDAGEVGAVDVGSDAGLDDAGGGDARTDAWREDGGEDATGDTRADASVDAPTDAREDTGTPLDAPGDVDELEDPADDSAMGDELDLLDAQPTDIRDDELGDALEDVDPLEDATGDSTMGVEVDLLDAQPEDIDDDELGDALGDPVSPGEDIRDTISSDPARDVVEFDEDAAAQCWCWGTPVWCGPGVGTCAANAAAGCCDNSPFPNGLCNFTVSTRCPR